MRPDLSIIQQWIRPESEILDLGCGEGELLSYLKTEKNVHGYGLEINPEKLTACIRNGVNVIEQNLDNGLSNFEDQSIDTVVMTQALQAVQRPDELLDEMLRIGKEAIVTFPNFGYWKTRFYLLLKGRMPMSDTLPYNWYDTPNIHMCTFRDFEILCREKGIRILNKTVVDDQHREHWSIRLWPAMLGEIAVYHITRR
ncbi:MULTISPECIES: methionine biosynthesis protein MetW [unclassified Thalassolituus]|uniref:methionine biosynthesis protein MetW n=1 Tax=unclassified Thalassolituus TaxID=2624967 RepID=UPI000B6A68F3|nr:MULTISPECIES: methionine biosynthesis protein MetW [unclassified Thalassolituus]MAE34125.1 methionine biosynthesis protein MetW [Oceanospirillaceae bacterium]MEC9409550.1 methionine biosynthesis protein MetW [Pseudomonadota bacterium]OUX64597.1 MAG: methionine biosynthesis protein MetW [Oceanospirillaceae bacterium TMED276]MBN58073.1 methionine biosynthesis protein MetW [Oceanospirillaceae bacterium]MDQ4423575.1 methionine biosynthesis protein MetW [Thalassolituus sp.]